ncbi:MAG: D-alanyl-D-alanine carboxypeptidase/D-alanyl-D-alanine-endopeptidase [Daejeonella sp.]
MFKTILSSFFLLLFFQPSFAQSINLCLSKKFESFEKDPQLKYGITSLTVLNAETGNVIFSKNGNTGLASASTLKTITSATAYYLLGKDFTWQTTLGYSGNISTDGTLNGDLILTGGGDPTLGSWRYEQTKSDAVIEKWIDAIHKAGIKKVSGRIIADDLLFGTQTLPQGWIWQDMGNYYGAGPNSLSWHENQFDLTFRPGKVGEMADLIRTEPDLSYLKILNEVKTGNAGSGDNVYAYSAPFSDIIYLRGTYGIDLKKVIAASMPDPAFEAVFQLQNTLKTLGIELNKPVTTSRKLLADKELFILPSKIISVHTSPTLDQVIYWFNQRSINLYGEHLLKTLAWKQGKEISTAAGAEVVKNFWNKKLGIDPNALNMLDGSGLSPGTRITTMAMAQILQSVKKEPWFNSYYESFPVYNNMKMKSGSIQDVLAFTGYQTTSSGVPVTFSFIINNYNGSASAVKQKMFKVLDLLK